MDRAIRFAGVADPSNWRDVAEACPWATYYHRPEWASLWARVDSCFTERAWLFELSDGQFAVLPAVVQRRRWRGPLVRSMYPWVYGGPIAPRHLTEVEWKALAKWLARPRLATFQIVGSPYVAPPTDFAAPLRADSTHRLNLRPGWEAVSTAFHKKTGRWRYRRGLRHGVTCRIAATEDEYRTYYALYQDSLRRWGEQTTISYPWSVFAELYTLRERGASLWLAIFEGTAVAGAIVLYHGKIALYWHGASSEAAFDVYANNVLQGQIIADACGRGLTWYDFNPSAGLEGVIRFKESFNAVRAGFSVWEFPSIHRSLLNTIRSGPG